MDETLLTGVVLALSSWTGRSRFSIEMEGHGRQETIPEDVSRTVGWFTTVYPVVLDVAGCSNEIETLKSVKEQLRKIPNKGFGYGILKHLNRIEELNHGLIQKADAEVGFNYLGRFDQVLEERSAFKEAFESMGDTAPQQALRPHLLGISAMVAQGRLAVEFTYNKDAHKRETIENLADRFKDVLKRIIQHCNSPAAGEHTPSDFPLAKLSMKKLKKLPALIESEQ
jgi:non-ribosomal peptide synthase protein (TIGR01720 family)